jgi:hypothetical protein
MKNRKNIFTATVLALAFALAPGTWASRQPDGGPDYPPAFTHAKQPAITHAVARTDASSANANPPAFTHAIARTDANSADASSPDDVSMPLITVHSAGDINRGKTGSFVLEMKPRVMFGGTFVNFSLSGTGIPGVDYVVPVSPAFIGASGFGVIQIQTLPDRRGSASRQPYSVVVTLEAGAGYAVGAPNSAQLMIKP